MSDKQRASEYAKQVERLYNQLGFAGLYDSFREKALGYAASGNLTGEQLDEYIEQLKPFWDPEWRRYLGDIRYVFDQTLDLANSYYGEWARVHRYMDQVRSAEAVIDSKLGKYDEDALSFIAKEFRRSVQARENYTELADRLKQSVDGRVVHHATTLGRTMSKGYSRRLKKIQADIAEIVYYEYVGIIRATTRPFCYACVGNHFSANELRLSQNGQIPPVIQYCGGYNCHHDAEPDPDYTEKDAEGRGSDWGVIEKRESGRIIRFYGTSSASRRFDDQGKRLRKNARKKK